MVKIFFGEKGSLNLLLSQYLINFVQIIFHNALQKWPIKGNQFVIPICRVNINWKSRLFTWKNF